MNFLFFAGSLREGSLNRKYVNVAYEHLRRNQAINAELVHLIDFGLPVYNFDIEKKEFPENALVLAGKVTWADAIVISSPENNGSIAAVLKNTIDWISRVPNQKPWAGKHILLMGASPGALGAIRGLWHTRQPFDALGCYVYPEMSGLPKADQAFDEKGQLKEEASRERLAKLLDAFSKHVSAMTAEKKPV